MTEDPQGCERRIDRLEIRLTEQDAVIEDLNATVLAQWRAIDALKRQVERLAAQVDEVSGRASPGSPEPPPPHY